MGTSLWQLTPLLCFPKGTQSKAQALGTLGWGGQPGTQQSGEGARPGLLHLPWSRRDSFLHPAVTARALPSRSWRLERRAEDAQERASGEKLLPGVPKEGETGPQEDGSTDHDGEELEGHSGVGAARPEVWWWGCPCRYVAGLGWHRVDQASVEGDGSCIPLLPSQNPRTPGVS